MDQPSDQPEARNFEIPGFLDTQSQVLDARFQKARHLYESGQELFPNSFRPIHNNDQIRQELGEKDHDSLEAQKEKRTVAGRIMSRRDFGKSIFCDLVDFSGKIQILVRKDLLSPEETTLFKSLDIGDLIGVSGTIFKTRTGELTILVENLTLVTKGFLPLPEKYHEINPEFKYRQRYVDLIMNEESRRVFQIRSKVVAALRSFMAHHRFMEVETPMLQPIPGGATARPFETHHLALDSNFYLRIAPELNLKRLLVGGFDRVFELNRCFRNEGLSPQHNPEFTTMEFYQSYADFGDLMTLTEDLFSFVAKEAIGTLNISYQGTEVDLAGPFARHSFYEAITLLGGAPNETITDREIALKYLGQLAQNLSKEIPVDSGASLAKIQMSIFDLAVEPKLINPTFITHYPAEVSPLARRNAQNPLLTDRFELFVTGRELGNAFSELNDPLDQYQRFQAQVAERAGGDDESMFMDYDYVRALLYGMPPAAGEGIGVDRLVMLLADVPNIKDVLLFPHLRPEF